MFYQRKFTLGGLWTVWTLDGSRWTNNSYTVYSSNFPKPQQVSLTYMMCSIVLHNSNSFSFTYTVLL